MRSRSGNGTSTQSHLQPCLTHPCNPCEARPVAPVSKCSPPTLETIRRTSRETKILKIPYAI
ncbi:hypothetical protein E2C01_004334 [Portunus trituberculatus]|uniref:Uncharacterized protein n=1 Tax=Portunus trituberculatus TaxID=210409 RepID=A0A5B7CW44_PORTR|nr:hypothetical protein [Portunus trituberculatus]